MATLSPWLTGSTNAQTLPEGTGTGPDFTTSLRDQAAVVVTITTARHDAFAALAPVGATADRGARTPWLGPKRPALERTLASGFIISGDGEILTNAHAVADVDQAIARLSDGRQFSARVVGLDRLTDVALLRIDARGLPAATLGDSLRLNAGEWVAAIGAPFGLDTTVTAGIVSSPRRVLPGTTVPLVQSDVAINPGSSGGPLFNLRGQVVGINSMVFSHTGGYMGVSFSVPIDIATRVANELRASGHVTRGRLGAKVQEVSPELARAFGLPAPLGALVLRVVHDSPAERSGLRSGDIVVGIDARRDATYAQLQQEIAQLRPGQPVALNVWRRGAPLRVDIVIGEAPADLPAARGRQPDHVADDRDDRLGLNLGPLTPSRRRALGIDSGLSVLEAHGASLLGGVLADDVVVAIGDRPVCDLAEFDSALSAAPRGRPVALLVLRDGVMAYLTIGAAD